MEDTVDDGRITLDYLLSQCDVIAMCATEAMQYATALEARRLQVQILHDLAHGVDQTREPLCQQADPKFLENADGK